MRILLAICRPDQGHWRRERVSVRDNFFDIGGHSLKGGGQRKASFDPGSISEILEALKALGYPE